MKSTITLALALVLTWGGAAQAQSDEGPVTIELKDGDVVQGRLLEFGKRIYRLKVGMKVVEVAEGDVKSVRFGKAKAPRATAPSPKALPRAQLETRIEPSAAKAPADLARWLKSDVPLTLEASKASLGSIVQTLRAKTGAPLLVQAGPSEAKVSLQLRRLPLRRVFPVLGSLAQVEATPFCGVIYLHGQGEPIPQVPELAVGEPLTQTLQKRWDLRVDRSRGVGDVFNQLLERAGVTSTQSSHATSLLNACSVGPVSIKGATLAELITLLTSQAVSVPKSWREPTKRLVWTSRNGVVQLLSSFEAPALALRARLQAGGGKEESAHDVMSELCKRLGVYCDSDGLRRLSLHRVALPLEVLTGREAIERVVSATKLKVGFEEGTINLVPSARPGVLIYGARSPEGVFERRQAAVEASDYAAYVRLFTRKSQLGLAYGLIARVADRTITDPESLRLVQVILKRHDAEALTNKKLRMYDNRERPRLLERILDPGALYAELATFLNKVGDPPKYPVYRSSLKVRTRGAWATGLPSAWDSKLKVKPLHFYRFNKRWYLHFARHGIPTRGGEPLAPPPPAEREETKALTAIRNVMLAQARFQEERGVHAASLEALIESKHLERKQVEGTGYTFEMCVGKTNPKRQWMLVASPQKVGGGARYLGINHVGGPYGSDRAIPLERVNCSVPAWAKSLVKSPVQRGQPGLPVPGGAGGK